MITVLEAWWLKKIIKQNKIANKFYIMYIRV